MSKDFSIYYNGLPIKPKYRGRKLKGIKKINELNNKEKGYLCIIISCLLFLIICIDFFIRIKLDINFIQYTPVVEYSFNLLLEKYMFYGVIISMQIGWTYLYGDIEKDFNKIIIISLTLFALMDMQGVINLAEFINSAFYIVISYFH